MEKGKCITDLTHMVTGTVRIYVKTSKIFTNEICSTGNQKPGFCYFVLFLINTRILCVMESPSLSGIVYG